MIPYYPLLLSYSALFASPRLHVSLVAPAQQCSVRCHSIAPRRRSNSSANSDAANKRLRRKPRHTLGNEYETNNNEVDTKILQLISKRRFRDAENLLLKSMEEFSSSTNNTCSGNRTTVSKLLPSQSTFYAVMRGWYSKNFKEDGRAAVYALGVLNTIEKYDLEMYVKPAFGHYRSVVEALAKNRDGGRNPSLAANLLLRYEEKICAWEEVDRPFPCKTYNVVLTGLSRDREGACEKAEAFFEKMRESKFVQPDEVTFNILFTAWARSYRIGAGLRTMELLQIMSDMNIEPSRISFCSAIGAIVNSQEENAPQRAYLLLERMESMYKNGNAQMRPPGSTYHAIIRACAKASNIEESVCTAEEILERIRDLDLDEINILTYNSIISSWSKIGGEEACFKAEKWFLIVKQKYQQDNISSLRPNMLTFNTLISACAKSGMSGYGRIAELYMNGMEEFGLKPDVITYSSAINAHVKDTESVGSLQRAEALLATMETLYRQGDINMRPTVVTYTTLIHALVRYNSTEAVAKAEQLLDLVENTAREERNQFSVNSTVPNAIYNAVIGAWCRENEPDRAGTLLIRMAENLHGNKSNAKPSTIMLNTVIGAYGRSNAAGVADTVRQLLSKMQKVGVKFDDGTLRRLRSVFDEGEDGFVPSFSRGMMQNHDRQAKREQKMRVDAEHAFKTKLESLVRSGDLSSLEKAEENLLKAIGKYEESSEGLLKPNQVHVAIVLDGWARRNNPQKAESLLELMEGKQWFQLDIVCYSIIIKAWVQNRSPGFAQRVENVMDRLESKQVKPDLILYSSVIDAFAKSDDKKYARKAEDLLLRMETNENLKPNVVVYTSVISGLVKSGSIKRAEAILKRLQNTTNDVDAIPYITIIDALATSEYPDSPQRAEALLYRMENIWKSGHGSMLNLDSVTYNTVIDIWASRSNRIQGAAYRADDILRRMETNGIRPDYMTFNSVINAWATSKEAHAPARVIELLEEMENRFMKGEKDTKPDAVIYASVIDTLVASKDERSPFTAERLIRRMEEQYEAGDEAMRPDARCYTSIIDIWANSNNRVAPDRIEDLLERMDALYQMGDESMKPDIITYTAVVRSLSCCTDKASAAKRAYELICQLERMYHNTHINPDLDRCNLILDVMFKSLTLQKDIDDVDSLRKAINQMEIT